MVNRKWFLFCLRVVLGCQLEMEDSLVKGLKLDLTGSILPEKSTKNAKAAVEYKKDYVNLILMLFKIFTRSSLDLFKGPTINGDAVVGNNGYIVGGEVSYDGKPIILIISQRCESYKVLCCAWLLGSAFLCSAACS